MMESLAVGAYRGVMTAAAGVAGAASRLPLAPARWRALGDRLGRLRPDERTLASGGTAIWLHAASVGELLAARPLLRRLRERFPERLYVVSTLTRTGLALAQSTPDAHLSLLLPLDAPTAVRRLLAHFALEAFLFTETEIWPTLLAELGERGIPTFMVSGRVGVGTAARARWLRPLYRRALASVDCCMQSEEDAARIMTLGADPRRVVVAGNLKFEGGTSDPPPDVGRLAAVIASRRTIVAGSTHEGEDEAVLEAYQRIAAGRGDVILLLAPRHPERVAAVAEKVRAAGLQLLRYSELAGAGEGTASLGSPSVVLLDVVGPLAHCYALGTIAFVGGSLVPAGGHNVLEPARAARPILVGPHTANAGEVVERLIAGGGAMRVSSAESLAWALAGLLDEPERMADMGRRARALLESGHGAVERHLKVIAARLSMTRFARATG
jgi:3-deoxy-D-manno-octulosonic-acid transferase